MPREAALHRVLEASRLSFADRNAWLADPAYFPVPVRGLLSAGFAAERRALSGETAAQSPLASGDPRPHDTRAGRLGEDAVTATSGTSNTHISVADDKGNVVAYTFTIESTGGNGIVVPGWGFLMNNELTDFNFDSLSHPNRVEGGKRPRSSMSPTIALRHGRPLLTVGSPGGSTISPTVLQILVDRLALGTPLPDAIAAPRAAQRNTAATTAEPAFIASPEGAALKARGHVFTDGGEIGEATGIEILRDGRFLAVAERLRGGGGDAAVTGPRAADGKDG
jgi:gamma-glutamyltranspeptidase/glutathione hydrolase